MIIRVGLRRVVCIWSNGAVFDHVPGNVRHIIHIANYIELWYTLLSNVGTVESHHNGPLSNGRLVVMADFR